MHNSKKKKKKEKKRKIEMVDSKILESYDDKIQPTLSTITIFTTTIIFIFWDSLMFYQIFLSPQVKRCAIITYKHGIYELPHELPNDLRLLGKILGNFTEW